MSQKPYTLARPEPTSFFSDGEDDDHYTTPPDISMKQHGHQKKLSFTRNLRL
jgi:hypothetical protein